MDAIKLIVDATVAATGQLAKQKNIELDVDKLSPIVKQVLNDNIYSIMDEWADAVEANIGNEWLKLMMNTQAYELAGKVLERYGQ